jgi:hypothetical protein
VVEATKDVVEGMAGGGGGGSGGADGAGGAHDGWLGSVCPSDAAKADRCRLVQPLHNKPINKTRSDVFACLSVLCYNREAKQSPGFVWGPGESLVSAPQLLHCSRLDERALTELSPTLPVV